jgi:hypothetical protein
MNGCVTNGCVMNECVHERERKEVCVSLHNYPHASSSTSARDIAVLNGCVEAQIAAAAVM